MAIGTARVVLVVEIRLYFLKILQLVYLVFKSIPCDLIQCKKAAQRADELIHIISEKVKASPGYSSDNVLLNCKAQITEAQNIFSAINLRIFSQPLKIGTGKNEKSLFFLLGLRTCFESKNFMSNAYPEQSNQVLSFSACQIC